MLEARVLEFFETVCPTRPQDSLLVAVSGGPDSVALLHLLLEVRDSLGLRLEVAHLDHSLRGKEGADDAEFVRTLAEEHGLALHRRRVNIPELWEAEGGSLEALARRERYAFLEEARAVAGARWIVTGHNANDQVETFLMNLLRGAGPRGLGGMLSEGPGPMCRPLLGTWRAEILEYLEAHNLPYCEDSTNQDLSRTRNWVRHRLVPFFEQELGAGVLEVLARDSQLMNDLDEFLSRESDRLLLTLGTAGPGGLSLRLEIPPLLELHQALQRAVLRAALQDLAGGLQEFSLVHIDALLDLARRPAGSGRIDLPSGLTAVREYDTLHLGPALGEETPPPPEPSAPLDLSRPGEVRWGRTRLRWTLAPAGERDPVTWAAVSPHRSCFDLRTQRPPVYLRGVRLGDRIEPSGMDGSQKLSDLLINRKVPRNLRTWVPVLCDNGGPEAGERILWVVGQRRSRHAPVESGTPEVVYFEAETTV